MKYLTTFVHTLQFDIMQSAHDSQSQQKLWSLESVPQFLFFKSFALCCGPM